MPRLLSSTELERAKSEFGDTAIEYQGGQPFLKSGFALSTLADPVVSTAPVASAPTGNLDIPPPTTGIQDAFNQSLLNLTSPGILTSQGGRDQIFDTQGKIESAKRNAELQRQELDRRRQQQVARYEDIFGRREKELRQTQEQQKGTERAVQFRLGLGGTPYAAEETRLKEAQRQAQLDDLASEKAFLIQQAENAFTDADFRRADTLTQEIQGIEDQEREITRQSRQDEIQNYQLLLQGLQEQRAQTGFDQKQASTQLENFITTNVPTTSITSESKQQIEKTFGLQAGTFDNFYTKYQEVQNAQSTKDQIAEQQALVNLLQDLPVGKSVAINGIEYQSLAQEVNPEQGLVEGLIQKYPDTGITVSDTLAEAQAKVPNSRIYQDQVRGPVGSGSGDTTFSATEKKKLEQAGLLNADRQTQLDFLFDNLSGLSEEEKLFQKDLREQQKMLVESFDVIGGTTDPEAWGIAWDTLKSYYPDIPNATLDQLLNKNKYYPK